ncbi:dihydroneopterin aldolase [Marinobacter daqiaonensis]|uniref:7,8-dihydroneopterin aldolase n=1 Tax=Marinobacter daqiaonensis TaxID=650891 RepID=A0A1I6JW42_9GAMM|nr:dihydroneopterin aldolase [Marinobacter daqiaonensis]SFR83166.1 dihydroneopterin aldolase [Marinobacter daqiaonensis]
MTDSVLIEGLAVETVIGVYDWERQIRQTLLLDLELAWDNREAAATDDVSRALDYAAVSDRAARFLEQCQPALLETAAEQLAACLMAEFSVPAVRLVLRKPGAVPGACSVGVRIERGNW